MDTNGKHQPDHPFPVMIRPGIREVASASPGVSAYDEELPSTGAQKPAAVNLRPWGFYEALITGPRFQVKRIVVEPGGRISLQKHLHRSENWVVVEGTALVTRGDTITLLHETESIYLPSGCLHRLENPGRIALTIIEVQCGPYLGEDDIIRLEDSYGRS